MDNVHSSTPLLGTKVPKTTTTLAERGALLFQDWWLSEITCALIAVLAIVVIVVILVTYDSSSLPDWPSVFTINSVISFFATIAKLSIMSAVSSSISQSKWLWYRQDEPRHLRDLQLFDSASRGPWGAFALLFSIRARHLAFIGSSIVILMLLFDTFLQQVVIYPDRLVASDKTATIVRAQRYQACSLEGVALPSIVDLSMKAAIYNGVFDIHDEAMVGVRHYCATGNCTFDSFSSLAVCSKCVDISSHIVKSCNNSECQLSLPAGPSIQGHGGQINSSVTNISARLSDIEPSVFQFSSLISKRMNNFDVVVAWECALSYCVNTYSASVTDGIIEQYVEETWRNNTATHSQDADLIYNPPASIIDIGANASSFKVASLAASAMNSFMSETFTGSGRINASGSGSAFSSDVMHALYDTEDLPKRIDNLATSMTNNIRQQNDSGSSAFSGRAFETETYVKVRWAWFSYPATVIVLSLFCLLGTIIETTHRDILIWKSSSLAMLFHGQALELKTLGKIPINTMSNITERSKDIKMALTQTNNEDWKLVQS